MLPAVAVAEDLGGDMLGLTENDALRALMGGGIEHTLDVSAQAALSGVAGRTTGGQASARGEVAWNLGVCRALVAGGEATLDRTADGEQVGGSVWGGFCLPFPMNRFEMIIRSDYALQPGLAALPIARRARYAGLTVDFKNTFIGWHTETREHAIFPIAISFGTFAQPDLDIGKVEVSIAAYRRTTDAGRVLEVLPVGMRSAGPALPAAMGGMYLSSHAYEFSPVRVARTSAGGLGDYALDADFVAGLGYAELTRPPDDPASMVVPVLHRAYDLYADITVRATKGQDTFALHLRRGFEPTYTDELLLDTRGELSWSRTHGKHGALLGMFAATTRRIDRAGPVEATPSGGARGVYTYQLPAGTQLALSGEVARSFYATLDDTVALDADWSAQLAAAFTFGWDRHPRKAATP